MANPTSSFTCINVSCPSHPQKSCITALTNFLQLQRHLQPSNHHSKVLRTMSLVADAPGLFQVFSDGSVKRVEWETSNDLSSNGCKYSKDVIIDSTKPISARIFLPDTLGSTCRLPVLVYFHGGCFIVGSTKWLGYHTFLGDFPVASQSIVLSVDYRLAPENRLPIAYDECYSSLEWPNCQASSEPWLERADLSRVFLSGDSAGGIISKLSADEIDATSQNYHPLLILDFRIINLLLLSSTSN